MDYEKTAKLAIAERCKYDLFYLVKYILGGGDLIDPKVHGPLCASFRHLIFKKNPEESLKYEYPSDYGRTEEEGMPNEAEKKEFWEWQRKFEPNVDAAYSVRDKMDIELTSMLYMMPRGTLKTTVMTIGGSIQWLLNFPDDRIALDSETVTKTRGFLAEIKGHLEENYKLRDVWHTLHGDFPDDAKVKKPWSTEMLVVATRKRAKKEPSIDTLGIGTTRNGYHYDIAFLDDLHSEQNSKTTEEIDKVKEHRKLVYSLLDPNCPMVVIGTRWAFSDAYQEIIDDENEDFNFITRSALSASGEEFYPRRLDRKTLNRYRRIQGAYLFSCQYLNNPVDEETAVFRHENFRHLTRHAMSQRKINWYGLVDPSYEGPYSDYCAIVIAGLDAEGRLYVKHIERKKITYSEIINEMFRLNAVFRPVRWGLEVVGTQKSLEYTLRQEEQKRGITLRCHMFKGQRRQKEERIRSLAPYYENHEVFHCIGAPNMDILEDELTKFPRARHDDVSDCFASVLEIGIRATGTGKKNVEARASKLDKDYVNMLNKPRSPRVGY
jgi:predicted phage terminase large subunit-like protein